MPVWVVLTRPCRKGDKVKPATAEEMTAAKDIAAEERVDSSTYTHAVLHIANSGLETFELSRNERYASGFYGDAKWLQASKKWMHGVLHLECKTAYTTWRTDELSVR